jgi:hypothetical protein
VTTHIVVGIATFRRARGLRRLLVSMQPARDALVAAGIKATIGVVVVDNDPQKSAAATVEELGGAAEYVSEPRIGLGYARNAAIAAAARQEATAVILIDDDQTVATGWLTAFVREHRAHPQLILFGPVITRHEDDPPVGSAWYDVSAGRRHYPAGSLEPYQVLQLGDGNTLLPLALIEDQPYADGFSTTGGQDTELFGRLLARGASAHFVPEAIALEHVPASRLSRRYALRRGAQNGRLDARIATTRGASRTRYGARAVGRLLLALILPLRRRRWTAIQPEHRVATYWVSIAWCWAALRAALSRFGE